MPTKERVKRMTNQPIEMRVNDIHGFNSPEHHAYDLGRKDHALGYKFDSNPFNPSPYGNFKLVPFWAQGWTERETNIMTWFQ